ncbi:MAG: hypothetical protein LBO69_01720 [Ignavibacteria bacterium]|jgi:hypothetical protein|nr:hypothetical protein [Ignavibacteria bacterium]
MKYKYTYIAILISIISILSTSDLFSATRGLTPLQISELVHSTQRSVTSLQGSWERSTDGGRSWNEVNVPFSDYASGQVIYKKEIRIDEDYIKTKTAHLLFQRLSGQVEVYFNSDYVTKVDGQLLPADIVIPKKLLINGSNELRLVFLENNNIDIMRYRAMRNAPCLMKGIISDPMLVGTSDIYVSDVHYQANDVNTLKGVVTITAGQISDQIIEKDDATGAVARKKLYITAEFQLLNNRTGETVTPMQSSGVNIDVSSTANINFDINTSGLKNWSTDSPELYKLCIRLKYNGTLLDEYFVHYGKRSIKNSNGAMLLNGVPLIIKAVSYTEHYGDDGSTLSAYRLEEDVKNIKLLGANTIQVKHINPTPYFVYLCDKYGMLLLLDLPLNNTHYGLLTAPEFVAQTKIVLDKLLQYYSTSPSFVALGIGNSVLECNAYNKLTKDLVARANGYSKLIYKQVDMLNMDFNTDHCNFLLVNTKNERFNSEEVSANIDKIKELCQLPLVMSFGTLVEPNNLNSYNDPMSNDYQSYLLKSCYNIAQQKHLSGVLINSYSDYRTYFPVLTIKYYDQYINTDGITDLYRHNRPSYSMLKALFNNERLPILNPGTYEQQAPISYIVIGLVLLLIVVYMLNRYSRFREYFIRAFLRPYNFYSDIRDRRIMSIIQTLILGAILAMSFALCLGGVLYSLRTDLNYSYLISAILPFNTFLSALYKLVWEPNLILLAFAGIFALLILLNAVLLRIIALILRAKIFLDNAVTITIWSALPFIILLPFGVLLSKLVLFSPIFISVFFILSLLILFWSYHRLLKAVSVCFDKPMLQIYLLGIVYVVLVAVIPLVLYEGRYDIVSFVNYWMYI